jgi:hypothetical protein
MPFIALRSLLSGRVLLLLLAETTIARALLTGCAADWNLIELGVRVRIVTGNMRNR